LINRVVEVVKASETADTNHQVHQIEIRTMRC